jgi:hypothetical protein
MDLVDITGRTIKEMDVRSGEFINVSDIHSGIYILVLSYKGEAILSKRISIKK